MMAAACHAATLKAATAHAAGPATTRTTHDSRRAARRRPPPTPTRRVGGPDHHVPALLRPQVVHGRRGALRRADRLRSDPAGVGGGASRMHSGMDAGPEAGRVDVR